MTSVARLCVLALIPMIHVSVSPVVSQPGSSSLAVTTDSTTDARSPSMAENIFESLVLPVAVPRLCAVPAGRAGPGRDDLRRGRPPPDTPDKPPRA